MSINSFQKQAARNLVLSPNSQAAIGGTLADASLTVRQAIDPTTVFEKDRTNRNDKDDIGKGTEFATNTSTTAWDTRATVKNEADAFLLGWMLAFIFGQEIVTGAGAPFTHTFTVPQITSTMPVTTVYVEETAAVRIKMPDMAAKMLSLSVPERGSVMATLEMVGTGRWTPGTMVAALPAIVPPIYLLGNDVQVSITPSGGVLVPFVGRQKSLSIKLDRASTPFKSSGDGLFASSVQSGVTKFSIDLVIAALQTDEINGWFENRTPLAITIATNPANPIQFGFTFPAATVKTNKLTNDADKVMWQVAFDETTCVQNGAQAAISAFIINNTPAYLVPA